MAQAQPEGYSLAEYQHVLTRAFQSQIDLVTMLVALEWRDLITQIIDESGGEIDRVYMSWLIDCIRASYATMLIFRYDESGRPITDFVDSLNGDRDLLVSYTRSYLASDTPPPAEQITGLATGFLMYSRHRLGHSPIARIREIYIQAHTVDAQESPVDLLNTKPRRVAVTTATTSLEQYTASLEPLVMAILLLEQAQGGYLIGNLVAKTDLEQTASKVLSQTRW